MIYFIPAWYQQDGWMENEQVWYRSRAVTEFDDTVKQVQLFFRRHVAPFKIVLLSFSPNFRHFLHRQGVYHAPYWSCFDAMQGICTHTMRTFSFHELSWPEDMKFIYSPFAVMAYREDQKFAQVEFAEDGNMFRIDLFHAGQRVSTNLYDDRGFVSCEISYRDGIAVRQRFFDPDGTWKFAQYLDDGHVVINPSSAWYLHGTGDEAQRVPYRHLRYARIDDVIAEVLTDFLADVPPTDKFIIAMHPRHSRVLSRVLAGRPKIVSVFGRRNDGARQSSDGDKLLQDTLCVVADNNAAIAKAKAHLGSIRVPVRVITPYEARMEFNDSQHLHVQNILVAVDALQDAQFKAITTALASYIQTTNHQARVCLFTRSSRYETRSALLARTQAALEQAGFNPAMAGAEQSDSEIELLDHELANVFSVAQCVDELHVSRTIREQRVVVDLSPAPDQFLQISAMSMGVPQITSHETEYIADGKNGKVLKDVSELVSAVDFYLSSVEHFNEAQIASYDLGSQFTADELVRAWKEVISIGQHPSPAAGER
ncbi:MAG: accessory Sec system protein Asp1 [Coriobacteriales bacterium]|nr:accessory Sec system protein Asp1 [Coriobacteriales bacterium]